MLNDSFIQSDHIFEIKNEWKNERIIWFSFNSKIKYGNNPVNLAGCDYFILSPITGSRIRHAVIQIRFKQV